MSFVLTITRCGSHDAEGKQFRKWSDAYNAAIIVRKAFSDDIPDKSRRTQWSGNGDTACWQGLGPDGQVRLIHIDPYSTGEPNPIKVVENNMELFNSPAQSNGIKMTQRDKMRELYHQHHGDKEAVIEAYAEAEQSGEVNRQRNVSGYGTKQYAQALWSDGEKKGWLVQNKLSQSRREVLDQPSLLPLREPLLATDVQKGARNPPTLEATDRKLLKFDSAPQRVIELYEEAVKAMNMKMPVSCAAVLRTMIEAICVDKGIIDGAVGTNLLNRFVRESNLKGKMQGLVEAGLVTQSHADVLHLIRLLGNDAVHRAEASETALLEVAIEIVENLVYQVYELPNKAERFPNRAK